MSFGYGAFGGQEWIRKVKPKPYFERRKSPAGEQGDIARKPDYHQLLRKDGLGKEIKPYDTGKEILLNWPIKLLVVAVLLGLLAAMLWLYFKH